MTIADKKVPPNPAKFEQGKPEPQPWMVEAISECVTHMLQCRKPIIEERPCLTEILAKHYAASQPLVPPTEIVWCVFTADSDAQYLQAVLRSEDDAQAYIASAKIRDAEKHWLDSWDIEAWKVEPLEPLVPQQEPTEESFIVIAHVVFHSGFMQNFFPTRAIAEKYVAQKLADSCEVEIREMKLQATGVPSEQGTPPQGTWEKKWERIDSAARVYRHSVHSSVCNCAACIVLLKALVGD